MTEPQDKASGPSGGSDPSGGCIKEGLVTVRAPKGDAVFFNPAQVFNRDLSVLVLKAFATRQKQLLRERSAATAGRCKAEGRTEPPPLDFVGFNVLEPLAATGLRSIRYLKELGGIVRSTVTNDLDPTAAQEAAANAALNGIPKDRFHATRGDGCRLMRLLAHPPLSRGTWKKISSLPVGSAIPSTFDLSCPPEELPLLPPLFKPAALAAAAAASPAPAADGGAAASLASEMSATAGQGEKETEGAGVPFWYDIIDVDPYGSCSPFLDSAVAAVRSGGLLCLTSTDMCSLVGNSMETAFYKYGGAVSKISAHHEVAVRLVLQAVAQAAARQRRAVQPLLCLSVDFYVRLFVRIVESPDKCKQLHQKEAMLFHCPSCEAFAVGPLGLQTLKAARGKTKPSKSQQEQEQQEETAVSLRDVRARANGEEDPTSSNCTKAPPGGRVKFRAGCVPPGVGCRCAECGETMLMGGPFYSGRYFDPDFVDLCLSELANSKETLPGLTMQPRILGILTALREELPDVPLFYQLPSLCTRLKLRMIKPAAFKAALRRLGYEASHFHRDPQAVKTNAPACVVFDLLRAHAAKYPPINIERSAVLSKPIQTEGIDFSPIDITKSGDSKAQVARWLPNPAPYWGPKGRAGKKRSGTQGLEHLDVKKQREEPQAASATSQEAPNEQGNSLAENPLL